MRVKIHRLPASFVLRLLLPLLLLLPGFSGMADVAPAGKRFESGERPVLLLEMFSSQGCSSCPPAERWFSGLRGDPRLWQQMVPVVFHVDYWDYLGWKDPYATLAYSQRQRRYELHGHSKAVYTPGFMLAGSEWRGWFQRQPVPPQPDTRVGNLIVELNDGRIEARFVRNADNRDLRLNAAVLGFDVVTPVRAGENRGRKLKQDFLVLAQRDWKSDSGAWQVTLPETDFQGPRAVAFWVSQGQDPKPLQATGGWLR